MTASESLRMLLDRMLGAAHGEDAQLRALCQAFTVGVFIPARASLMGQPVEVLGFDYDGNERRGLVARCRSEAVTSVVSAADLVFPAGSAGALHVDVYRAWLGIEPTNHEPATPKPRPKATDDALDLEETVELVVQRPKDKAVRCTIVGSDREITLRCKGTFNLVPGEVLTVLPNKQWRYGGHPYLSGEIVAHRIDAPALGLEPLQLLDEWPWDPAEQYWGEDDGLPDWAKPIVARGVRASFEMERVIPRNHDPYSDGPVLKALGVARTDLTAAREILLDLLEADLRCLDAHASLGNLSENWPQQALRHYEVGVRIGELSLGASFDGVLQWGRDDNRPFLRCLHGYGLSLWRLQRWQEATKTFERMLWLNPQDNQGARFLLPWIRDKVPWEDANERI